MNDLATQIRDLVDSTAPTITSEEIAFRRVKGGVKPLTRRLPVRVLATAFAAVLALCLVAVFVLVARPSESAHVGTAPSTATASDRNNCIHTDSNLGCTRSLKKARIMLGIPLRTPTIIPNGWSKLRHVVSVYPAGTDGNAADVLVYREVWAPNGTPLDGSQSNYFSVRERAANASDAAACGLGAPVPFGDGPTACGGSIGPASVGVPGGSTVVRDSAHLDWIAHGILFHVEASGLPPSVVLHMINSLE